MRITEVITEAIEPIGANTAVGNHIEVHSKGEGDNKIIIEANTKVTMDHLITPTEAIIITIMAIIEVEVAVAMVETITDLVVAVEAIIEAIIIINKINITHMMMDHSLNNMDLLCTLCGCFNYSPKHCFKGEHDINNLMEKMSLVSSNQHQNGLYQ